jgi:general stress protein 26
MPELSDKADAEPKSRILEILEENRILTVATLRPDGWPQATVVGYVHDDLMIYFAVGRNSQKLANIRRDPRVSIAVGKDSADHIRGLSMAARAIEVTDFDEVGRLNALIWRRYPEQGVFAPREASSAVIRAAPKIISLIDLPKGPGEPELFEVASETTVHRVSRDGSQINGRRPA